MNTPAATRYNSLALNLSPRSVDMIIVRHASDADYLARRDMAKRLIVMPDGSVRLFNRREAL